jgi:NAD(P)-dependent dehydrogenase (short-subunit alcohol dehydrogenase family)
MTGKVAIVTGATAGIGYATAAMLLRCGAKVVITGTRPAALQGAAARLRQVPGDVLDVTMDLADERSIQALIERTLATFGRIDVLHNNAADLSVTKRDRDIESMDSAVWDRIFNVNVRGTMLCSKYVLPHMVRGGGGSIVNTASALGVAGSTAQAAYGASKAAIIQMSRSIATSHGKRGVRCNAVLPGLTRTDAAAANLPPELWRIQAAENLTPYIGDADSIASLVVFLASDAARYITGQAILADGGSSAHIAGFAQLNELGI